MRKSIYLLTTTPSSHTHRFHPLPLATPTSCSPHPYIPPTLHDCPIHTFNLCKVQSMDDNCGEWVECMGVASGCGEQEVGVASGSGWNLWVWLLGVVVRRYRIAGNFRGVLIFVIFVTLPRVTKFSTHEIFHPRIFSRLLRIGLRESRNLKPRKLILKTRDSFSRKFAPPKITRYTVYRFSHPTPLVSVLFCSSII